MSEKAHPEHRLRGIALRLSSVLFFAVMGALIKIASAMGASTVELMFYRNLFSLPVVLFWVGIGPGWAILRTKRPSAHATRAVVGMGSMVLSFTAIVMLPLAEATAIGFAAPLFATILSAIFLGERVGRHRWGAVLVGLLGVIVVMQPGGSHLPAVGLAVAVCAALGVAGVVITLRQLGATEPAPTTVFWFAMASVLVLGTLMPFVGKMYSPAGWTVLVLLGLIGGLAQLLLTASLRDAPIPVLAPFDYTQLVWAMLLGWLLWSNEPTAATLAGGLLIAASGIYTGYREHRRHRALNAPAATPPETL